MHEGSEAERSKFEGKGKRRTLKMFVKLEVEIARGQQMGGVEGSLL